MAVVTESPTQIPFSKHLVADGWALHWSTDRSYESTSVLLHKMWQWQSLSHETLAVYWGMGWDLGLEFPWVTICNWGSSSGCDLLWKTFFFTLSAKPWREEKNSTKGVEETEGVRKQWSDSSCLVGNYADTGLSSLIKVFCSFVSFCVSSTVPYLIPLKAD